MMELGRNSEIFAIPGALPLGLCADLIARFETSPEQQLRGVVGNGLNEDIKRSTDLMVKPDQGWHDADQAFFKSLADALAMLQQDNEFFNDVALIDEGYQLQRTLPGEYYHWHCDFLPPKHRVMVAVWYLNTLDQHQGGRTQFSRQDVSVIPQAGTLLLFPPYHTHRHRGEQLKHGSKYIATTWLQVA